MIFEYLFYHKTFEYATDKFEYQFISHFYQQIGSYVDSTEILPTGFRYVH